MSWNDVRRAVHTGKVCIEAKVELDETRRMAAGTAVTLEPRARTRRPPPEVAVHIVFEDADVIVIDKPSGVSSVPYEKKEAGTALDLIRAAWRTGGRKRATAQPLFVVHRIDKETSGLLLFAKNKGAERALGTQFREHTVARTYLCVVHGEMKSRRIETRLVRDRGDGLRGSTRFPDQGKVAITHVEAERRLAGGKATLCRVRLETGKTHQIRIHLAEAGHPLVGEKVYIRDYTNRGGEPLPSPRLLLHAATLGFVHPRTEEKLSFESEVPSDFEAAVKKMGTC